jgi:pyroglutamyl-peptidase
MRPVVLLTGFGPFPGAPENPSQRLVEALRDGRAGGLDCELHSAVLPTRYDAAREAALRLHRRLRPDIAVHFGFSLKAQGFTLERMAANRILPGRLDAGGARPARAAIRPAGPRTCASTLPLESIRAALADRGLPAAFSDDAGGYVCNLIFYAAGARRGPAMAGFVHVPLIAETPPRPAQRVRAGRGLVTLSRGELLEGARIIVETCRAEWRRRRATGSEKEPPAESGRPSLI